MTSPPYDILKKDNTNLVWIEAAQDLEMAKARIRELVATCKGDYVVFDQRTRKIVANSQFA